MIAVSAIKPLRVAVFAILEGLAGLGGPSAPRVFLVQAPRGTVEPFLVIDAETEDESGSRYGQSGQGQSMQIRCWGADPDAAQDLYAQVKAALHGVALTVTGFQTVRGQMRRLTGFKDEDVSPDERGPYCVVGELTTETRVP